MASDEEIRQRFLHHPPKNGGKEKHEEIRERFIDLALSLNRLLPESREKSLALTDLQSAAQWANATVAIHVSGAVESIPDPVISESELASFRKRILDTFGLTEEEVAEFERATGYTEAKQVADQWRNAVLGVIQDYAKRIGVMMEPIVATARVAEAPQGQGLCPNCLQFVKVAGQGNPHYDKALRYYTCTHVGESDTTSVMNCGNCERWIPKRNEGHVNSHWVEDPDPHYVCEQGHVSTPQTREEFLAEFKDDGHQAQLVLMDQSIRYHVVCPHDGKPSHEAEIHPQERNADWCHGKTCYVRDWYSDLGEEAIEVKVGNVETERWPEYHPKSGLQRLLWRFVGGEEFWCTMDDLLPSDDVPDPNVHYIEHRSEGEGGRWFIQHPLACRPDLMACPATAEASTTDWAGVPDGKYPYVPTKGSLTGSWHLGERLST